MDSFAKVLLIHTFKVEKEWALDALMELQRIPGLLLFLCLCASRAQLISFVIKPGNQSERFGRLRA